MADQVNFPDIYVEESAGDGGVGSLADPYNDFADINWTTGGDNSVFDYVNGAPSQSVIIHLKRGEEWFETLIPLTAGTATYPILIEPYGSGIDPTINRASVETGWSPSNTIIIGDAVQNGDLEAWTTGNPDDWTKVENGTSTVNEESSGVHGGSKCVRFDVDGSNSAIHIRQSVSPSNGDIYDIEFWYKVEAGATCRARFWITIGGTTTFLQGDGSWSSSSAYYASGLSATSWTKVSITTDAVPAGAITTDRFQFLNDSAASKSIWFDDIRLEKGAYPNLYHKTFANAPGIIVEDDSFIDHRYWDTDLATTYATMSAGTWAHDGTTAYVWCSDDADPDTHSMEVAAESGNNEIGILINNLDYITVDGLLVKHCTTYGIRVLASSNTDCTNIIIENNTILRVGLTGIGLTDNVVNGVKGIFDSEVKDNIIVHCGRHGTACGYYVHDCLWSGNIISFSGWDDDGPGGHGISSWSIDLGAVSTGNIVEHNIVSDTFKRGHPSEEGAGIQADNYTFQYTYRYNISFNNGGCGFRDNGGIKGESDWYYNLSYGNGDQGLLTSSKDSSFYNNVSFNNGSFGIQFISAECTGGIARNNIMAENGDAEFQANSTCGELPYVDYNCYWHTGSPADFMRWNGSSYTYANWLTAMQVTRPSNGVHSINQNPKFMGISSANFHLQSGSPCRDIGAFVPSRIPYVDFDGVAVPQESRPSMGAFEFLGGSQTIIPGGIAGAEAFGGATVFNSDQYVIPGAIGSLEAFGSLVISQGGVSPGVTEDVEDTLADKDLEQILVEEVRFRRNVTSEEWRKTGGGSWILGELITNGELDHSTDGWTVSGSGSISIVPDGKLGSCMRIDNSVAGGQWAEEIIEVEGEKEYELTFYARKGSSGALSMTARAINRQDDPDHVLLSEAMVLNDGWELYRSRFTTDIGQSEVVIVLWNTGLVNVEIDVDRVSVQEISRVPMIESEIVDVKIDNVSGYEVFSIVDVDSQPSTDDGFRWYCEEVGDRRRLYVRTFDGDPPSHRYQESGEASGVDEQKYLVMMEFWIGFCNRQDTKEGIDRRVILSREENIFRNPTVDRWDKVGADDLLEWDQSGNVESDSAVVADSEFSAYSANLTIAGGTVQWIRKSLVRMKPRRRYRIGFWYAFGSTDSEPEIQIRSIGSGEVYLNAIPEWVVAPTNIALPSLVGDINTWLYYELEFISHPDHEDYEITFFNNSVVNGSVVWFDDLYFWRIYQPQYYYPFLHESSFPGIFQGVGDYYQGDIKLEFGAVDYINNGWFYDRKDLWEWHNNLAYIKFGDPGWEYETYQKVFTARTRRPSFRDGNCEIDHIDARVRDLTKIPINRFTLAEYPDMDTNWVNKVKPILIGKKENITPIYLGIDSSGGGFFHLSDIEFNSEILSLESIDQVEFDDQGLTGGGTDYEDLLSDGQFRTAFDTGKGKLRVNAKGVVVDFEDGSYSNNVADIVYFIMVHLNGVDPDNLNYKSLISLKAGRTQQIGIYLKNEEDTRNVLQKLMQSCTFHIFPLLSGIYISRFYDPSVPSDTVRFNDEDIRSFEMIEVTDECFQKVVIQYDQDPTTSNWSEEWEEGDDVEGLYDVKSTLILQTYLTEQAEAEALSEFFRDLISDPPDKIRAIVDQRSLLINPTYQAIFNYGYKDELSGEEIPVLENQVYRLLELTKFLHEGESEVIGTKGMQVSGVIRHVDVAHADHDDEVHGDVAHGDDAHLDSHGNVVYQDVPYDDSYADHTDESHSDNPHEDGAHGDVEHVDVEYVDFHQDHDNAVYLDQHIDTPHEDTPHTDDPHEDHTDSHTDNEPHSDTHTDEAHQNSPYQDSHGDGGHDDVEHIDTHTDLHDDSPHQDSYF